MKQRKLLSIPVYVAVYAAVIVACVLLDQLTKIWIFDGLLQSQTGKTVTVIPNFLYFSAVYNDGCIFGMLDGAGADVVFFIITVAATPLYVYFLMRSRTRSVWGQIGFAFIVGGAIGNAIDRAFVNTSATFFSGEVRDFISFGFFPPVFNVADSFLTVGVVMAIIAVLFFDPDSVIELYKQEKAQKATNSNGNADLPTDEKAECNEQITEVLHADEAVGRNNELQHGQTEQNAELRDNADDGLSQRADQTDNKDGLQ